MVGEGRGAAAGVGAPAVRDDRAVLTELVELAELMIARPYLCIGYRARVVRVREAVLAAVRRPTERRAIHTEEVMLCSCLVGILDEARERQSRFVGIASAILPHVHENLRGAEESWLADLHEGA